MELPSRSGARSSRTLRRLNAGTVAVPPRRRLPVTIVAGRRADNTGAMRSETITLDTGSTEAVVDITAACEDARPRGRAVHVFVPHATAGVALIETGAGSEPDLLAALRHLLPADDRWRHAHGSPGHGRSHVMPALVPPYATIPVLDGRLALGTWQSVCVVDVNVDNPRRTVRLSFLAG